MITLSIPPNEQLFRVNKLLTEETGSASKIKSRLNRQSVLEALSSCQQALKKYNLRAPPNGLFLFCGKGLSVGDDPFLESYHLTGESYCDSINESVSGGSLDKEKKILISLEPPKPIKTFQYQCDDHFHTHPLKEMLVEDQAFGFVVMDGHGCLLSLLQGTRTNTLLRFTVDLPRKHGRGGQSALRFARLRLEKRLIYVKKVAEFVNQNYLPLAIESETSSSSSSSTSLVTSPSSLLSGLVFAGSADFKLDLLHSDVLDPRLKRLVLRTLDVSYGMEAGLNEAINQMGEFLGLRSGSEGGELRLMREKRIFQSYFEELARESGKIVYSLRETMHAVEMGWVERLVVWEGIQASRVVLRESRGVGGVGTGRESVHYVNNDQLAMFLNSKTNGKSTNTFTLVHKVDFLDWLVSSVSGSEILNGLELLLVTDHTSEGSQFTRGFGGVGGFLRWKVEEELLSMQEDHDDEEEGEEIGLKDEGEEVVLSTMIDGKDVYSK